MLMTTTTSDTLDLTEWQPLLVERSRLGDDVIGLLATGWSHVVRVEGDPLGGGDVRLIPLGKVGVVRITPDLELRIAPKIPIRNLFRMIERVWDLDVIDPENLTRSVSLPEILDSLALIFARRVIARTRRGLWRGYRSRSEALGTVRGRINMPRHLRRPRADRIECTWGEQVLDNRENRVILAALDRLLRIPSLSERTRPTLRAAWRGLLSRGVTLDRGAALDGDRGTTLNAEYRRDYRLLHALCRFFLENTAPSHIAGEDLSPSFLIDMPHLYERYVAVELEELLARSRPDLSLSRQERARVGERGEVTFIFDILIRDRRSGETLMVIDTKYRLPEGKANRDIYQVVAYAAQQNCREALLLYPEAPGEKLDVKVGDVRVRSGVFRVDGGSTKDGGDTFLDLTVRNLVS